MRSPDQDFLSVGAFIWALLKQIWITTTFFTVLSTVITIINHFFHNILSVESAPITLLGTLVSFMLTIKLNNDQKTWTDGRAEWSSIAANSRQLATVIWHNASVDPQISRGEDGLSPQQLKEICMKLLRAFAVATKYGIEGEGSAARDDQDIKDVVSLLPAEKPPILRNEAMGSESLREIDQYRLNYPNAVARDILTTLSACIATLHQTSSLPTSLLPTIETSLQSLQTSLSSLTRTTTTTSPHPAMVQTRLSVYAYLFFLPFQLNQAMGWWTIPAEFVVAVVYLGFMAVGVDIGSPFKAGLGRLDIGGLVEDLKRQIDDISQTESDRQNIRNNITSRRTESRGPAPEVRTGILVPIDVEAQPLLPNAISATPSLSSSG